jgi:hypothetical protein
VAGQNCIMMNIIVLFIFVVIEKGQSKFSVIFVPILGSQDKNDEKLT